MIRFIKESDNKGNYQTLAILNFNDDNKYYCPIDEIEYATIEDLFKYTDWSLEEKGLKRVGKNEDGEDLYQSEARDFVGKKTYDEIKDIETDIKCVKYSDGNNFKMDIIDSFVTEEFIVENNDERQINPAYYFLYTLISKDGEKINVTTSNISGNLSPYYIEDVGNYYN